MMKSAIVSLVVAVVLISLHTAECRKLRYRAQFGLQLSNLTYEAILSSPQQIFIVDPDDVKLSADQNAILRKLGKSVFAYLSVGQAETFRPYWQDSWRIGSPTFLTRIDDKYQNGVVVEFWQPEWQAALTNYLSTNILPFGYSGILMDYLYRYEEFTAVRPTAAQDMVQFAARLVSTARMSNPAMLIVTQDAVDLYPISEQYRMMVDGISAEEVFFHEGKVRSLTETKRKMQLLREVANDKKVVMLEEYVDKNRSVCEFYKKCALEGFMCGVFGIELTGTTRDCVMEKPAAPILFS